MDTKQNHSQHPVKISLAPSDVHRTLRSEYRAYNVGYDHTLKRILSGTDFRIRGRPSLRGVSLDVVKAGSPFSLL